MLGYRRVGAADGETIRRDVRIRTPHLLAVEHPLVPIPNGFRRQAGEVTASAGLAEKLAGKDLGGQEVIDIEPLLLGCTESLDGRRDEFAGNRNQLVVVRYFETRLGFHEGALVGFGETSTAPLRIPGDAPEAAGLALGNPGNVGGEILVLLLGRAVVKDGHIEFAPSPDLSVSCQRRLAGAAGDEPRLSSCSKRADIFHCFPPSYLL